MSEEYDNTNKGAAFPPFAQQKLILQGKIDVHGADMQVVLLKDQTKSGTNLVTIWSKVGTMFVNDKKGNENAPDYSGPFLDKRIAAWKKTGAQSGKPFLSLSVTEDQQEGSNVRELNPGKATIDDDEIPF